MATYEEILADINKARENLPKESLSISEGSPAYEALVAAYAPELAKLGKTPIPQKGALLPSVAGQTDLQGEAATLAARQAGLIGANQSMVFNPATGTFDLPANPQGGIAGYQQYLDDATTAQQAGQDLIIDPTTGKARPAAGGTAMTNAQTAFDAQQAAAAAGQGASDAYTQAAAGYVGPGAYQQFMSPYQQDVIDATMADMNQKLQEQQAQLGASAGNAFGGGRFGVAQGQLASSGAIGQALAGAQLRQQGFSQAQQAAAQAYQQQMGMGSQAMQQAQQNAGLYGAAGQSQLGLSQAQQGQLATQLQQLGQQGQMAQGMATLQPSLAAQNIGQIGQLGAQQQAQAQTILDTARAAAKQQAYEPYERLSFMGSQLTGLKGGYPGATYSAAPQPGTSPTAGILGLLTGGAGLATGIAGMMNPQPTFNFPMGG
jgi:hypothetical protein|tara:strand:+ start:306 stop:1598 length:1293 start_codon:yes stop_codon:yes gene_type:complete